MTAPKCPITWAKVPCSRTEGHEGPCFHGAGGEPIWTAPEPKWEDVEVGDAIIADRKSADVTISGTVTDATGTYVAIGNDGYNMNPEFWTLLDIIKPEPQLPTTVGSVVQTGGVLYARAQHTLPWWPLNGPVCRATESEMALSRPVVLYDAGKK